MTSLEENLRNAIKDKSVTETVVYIPPKHRKSKFRRVAEVLAGLTLVAGVCFYSCRDKKASKTNQLEGITFKEFFPSGQPIASDLKKEPIFSLNEAKPSKYNLSFEDNKKQWSSSPGIFDSGKYVAFMGNNSEFDFVKHAVTSMDQKGDLEKMILKSSEMNYSLSKTFFDNPASLKDLTCNDELKKFLTYFALQYQQGVKTVKFKSTSIIPYAKEETVYLIASDKTLNIIVEVDFDGNEKNKCWINYSRKIVVTDPSSNAHFVVYEKVDRSLFEKMLNDNGKSIVDYMKRINANLVQGKK